MLRPKGKVKGIDKKAQAIVAGGTTWMNRLRPVELSQMTLRSMASAVARRVSPSISQSRKLEIGRPSAAPVGLQLFDQKASPMLVEAGNAAR